MQGLRVMACVAFAATLGPDLIRRSAGRVWPPQYIRLTCVNDAPGH